MPDILLDREFQPNESSGATSQAPQSHLSGQQIAQPYEMLAHSLDKMGSELESGSEALQRGAIPDLENQAAASVSKDANGNVVVGPRPFIFGAEGRAAYDRTVRMSALAEGDGAAERADIALRQKYRDDPEGYLKAADAYRDKSADMMGQTAGPLAGRSLARAIDTKTTQTYRGLLSQKEHDDLTKAEHNFADREKSAFDALSSMARGNISESSPDWQAAHDQLANSLNERMLTPGTNYTKEQRDFDAKQYDSELGAQRYLYGVDQVYKNAPPGEARKAAETAAEDIRTNPKYANLSMQQREQYYHQAIGEARINDGLVRQDRAELHAAFKDLQDNVALGGRLDPADADRLEAAMRKNGDTAGIVSLHSWAMRAPLVGQSAKTPLDEQAAAIETMRNGGISPAFFQSRMGGAAHTEGMNPEFAGRLSQAVTAAEAATGEKAQFTSLVRDTQTQARLYWNYEHGLGGLAAPPGHSLHEKGEAADLKAGKTLDWLHAHAGEFGLEFLPGHAGQIDPGHIQIAGNLRGGAVPPGSPFMNDVAQIETGNRNVFSGTDHDYPGQPGSRSQGFFQIDVPTWGQFAGRAGVDTKQYPTPMNATREIQERVAAVIPLSRFGARTREMLMAKYGQLDTSQTLGQLAAGQIGNHPAIALWKLTNQERVADSQARDDWKQMVKDYETDHTYPNQAGFNSIARVARAVGDTDLLEEMGGRMNAIDTARGISSAPLGAQQNYISQGEALSQGGGLAPGQAAVLRDVERSNQAITTGLQKDPVATTVRNFGDRFAAPAPLDFKSLPTLVGGLQARSKIVDFANQNWDKGTVPRSALSDNEVEQFKGVLSQADPMAKAALFGAISTLPEGIRDATLKKLGGSEPSSVAEAAAGSLAKEAPGIAESIFRGQAALKADARLDPEKQDKTGYLNKLDAELPRSIFGIEMRSGPASAYSTTVEMTKARYADLANQAGKTTFNPDLLKQAVQDVTGGVLSHNGGSFITPHRGTGQEMFDRVMNGLSDGDFLGVATLGGDKVTADYVRSNGQLETVGDGKYRIRLGRDPMKPVYAYSAGQKFILDLGSRAAPGGLVSGPPAAEEPLNLAVPP